MRRKEEVTDFLKKHKSWWNFVIIAFLFFIGLNIVLWRSWENLKDSLISRTLKDRRENSSQIADRIDEVYRLLRLLSRQDEMKEIEQKKLYDFNKHVQKNIQEVYNIIHTRLEVSEIYFSDHRLNTRSSDPHLKHPYSTFDEFIVSKNKNSKPEVHIELPEIEDYEYAEMEAQISEFKNHYAKHNGNEWDLPLLASKSVITCDNSHYDPHHPNDWDRSGIILSVPYFNKSGSFSGMISAIVLNRVFDSLLRFPNSKLILNGEVIGAKKEKNEKAENVFWEAKLDIPIAELKYDKLEAHFKLTYNQALLLPEVKSFFRFVLLSYLCFLLVGLSSFQWAKNTIQKQSTLESELDRKSDLLKFKEAEGLANEKLATLGEMAGSIAHEVNNPLQILSGQAAKLRKIMQEKGVIDEQALTIFSKIDQYLARITKIIRGLKFISRDSSNDPFQSKSVQSILAEVQTMTEDKIKNHAINFSIVQPQDFEFECRDVQVAQILINLISNSIDAIADTATPWIQLHIEQKPSSVLFKVIDSGKTPSQEIIEKLMTPFFTTKASGKGTGLGLNLSKKIAHSHNGKLWIDATKENTSFILELPLKQNFEQIKKAA